MNANRIKAEVRKQFKGIEIVSVNKKAFSIFTVTVSEQRAKSVRRGFIMGEMNWDENTVNGVVLEKKVNWAS